MVFTHQQKFFDSIKILIAQSQIFGVVTFRYNEKRFQKSHLICIYTLILMALYIFLLLLGFYRIVNLRTGTPLIYRSIDMLLLVFTGTYSLVIWTSGLLKSDRFISLIVRLVDFDCRLKTVCINYRKNQKKHFGQILSRSAILLLLIAFLSYCSIAQLQNHDIFSDMADYILMVLNSVSCHLTIEVVEMITMRFSLINNEIEQFTTQLQNNEKMAIQSNSMTLPFGEICALHHHLAKSIKQFNGVFGLTLLVMFAYGFTSCVISLFYTSAELQRTPLDLLGLFWSSSFSVNYMIDMTLICRVCFYATEEAKKSGALIHKIDTENHDLIDEIEMFSLQIANQQIEFNAAGFFPINYTLLFSIIGGVTTYIIILIQLAATLSENTN